jgi:hypothetical protein
MGQLISMKSMPIEAHKAYLQVTFNPEVPASLFSEYEWDLLCNYGSWPSSKNLHLDKSDLDKLFFVIPNM